MQPFSYPLLPSPIHPRIRWIGLLHSKVVHLLVFGVWGMCVRWWWGGFMLNGFQKSCKIHTVPENRETIDL